MHIKTIETLKKAINSTEIVVDQWWINEREIQHKKRWADSKKGIDYTILESKINITNAAFAPKKDPRNNKFEHYIEYDSRFPMNGEVSLTDFKCIKGRHYNVGKHSKKAWFQCAIDDELLTDFLFYRQFCKRPEDQLLQIGDKITFEFLGVWDAQKVVTTLEPSQFIEEKSQRHEWWIPEWKLNF